MPARHTWVWIALALVASAFVVAILFIAFRNLTDQGGPSASTSSTPEPSASTGPNGSASPGSSFGPSNAPAAGWTPVEIAGMPWVDGIAEHDARLVAVGRTGIDTGHVVVAYSDNGVTWIPVDISNLGLGEFRPQGPNMIGLMSLGVIAGEPGFVAIGSRLAADFSVENLYLFSPDGVDWQLAIPPGDCVAGYGTHAVGSGFINFGEVCVADGAPPPGPIRIVTSTDGRSWTSRMDSEMAFGSWTSDGRRIVMLVGCCGDPNRADVAISDNAAATWRHVADAFPAGVSVYNVAWGHDRYIAEASWINANRPGDPDHAVCASDTGQAWTCDALSSVTAPPEERRAVGALTSTSTGFASVLMVPDDPMAPIPGLTAILATSPDGVAWTFATVPAMKEMQLGGLLGTSHGVFAWGMNPHEDGSSAPEPLLLVHLAPLP